MLEYYYKERRSLVDFRRGPIGPYFDEFAAHLKENGYARIYVKTILGRCCLLNTYLIDQGITTCQRVTPSLIESFLNVYLPKLPNFSRQLARLGARCSVKHLSAYMVGIGAFPPAPSNPPMTRYSWMLEPYLKYLREDCERSVKTIRNLRGQLSLFLEDLGDKAEPREMKSLRADEIEAYIKRHLSESQSSLQRLASALRGFLQFCARKHYTALDLSGVIPSVPSYRMTSVPRGVEDSDLQRMLDVIPKDTPIGCRDYAIVLLLMAYGIRGKLVAELLLEDLCWHRSTIRIRAKKGGKEVLLPLLEAVGEAIVAYLRHRPDRPYREVFLSTRGPFKPLSGLALSHIVRQYLDQAHIKVARGGTSTLRHSWAIRALAQDVPMKAIADVLGHRCLDTTFIYAKADLKALRQVAMPWPGGTS